MGILCDSSSITVSQWKCFTASIESLKMESCASELMSFISALILVAICDMTDFDILGEFTTTEAIERYVLRVIRLMHLLREGVPILYA